MRRRRSGFTFVEILTSMTIVAILAGILIPKTGDFIKRARAAVAVSDIRRVADAVTLYQAGSPVDSANMPATTAMGQVPDSLKADLGPTFSFVKPNYSLQYNNWTLNQSVNGQTASRTIIGVTMQTDDARLGQLVMAQLSFVHFQWGNNYVFIFEGL